MISFLQVEGLTKSFGDLVLFENLTFGIFEGDRIGLIAKNGTGKTTLLNIITGKEDYDSGNVVYRRDLRIGYLPQDPHFPEGITVLEACFHSDSEVVGVISAYEEALISGDSGRIEELVEQMDHLKAWDYEYRAKQILSQLKINNFDQKIEHLSGGQLKRVALANVLISEPQLLILDEPTNHLDSSGRQRLYDWVEKYRSTLLVVSHDRTLLNLLPEICELEKHQINYYGGNYEFYKEQKTLMQEALQQRIEEKEKALRIARKVARETAERRDKQNVRGEKSNIKKGVPRIVLNALQGKSEKSTSKLTGVHQEKAEKLTNERNQLRGSLSPTAALKTDFNSSSLHTGKILVTAKEINFSYHSNSVNNDILTNNEINSSDTGYLPNPNSNDIQENSISKQQLWQAPVSFQLKSGDRLRIEGANGSGKTTLLKLITGQLQPQEGTLTRTDFSYVYLNQEYSIIDDRNSILEQTYAFNSRNLPEHEIKIILNRYLFPASEWDKSCRKLSGGEKMRLAFCCLMISNNTPDMFILDEPTNNLDIQSIEIITATIKNYAGTVIAISHDNYFIQEIGVEQCILLS